VIESFLDDNQEHITSICHPGWSFQILVHGFGRKFSSDQQKKIMFNFSFMELLNVGKVDLTNPEQTFWIVEEHGENTPKNNPPKRVFFLRQVCKFYL
jgi:hypothetical protein